MTGSADFTKEEWDIVLEGPTSAGMIVSAAERGGTFREIFAIAKSFTEARAEHGESALLDEVVSHKPEMDKTRSHSPEELRSHGLERIREAVALVEAKASVEELGDYRNFVITLANKVAAAKTKGDETGASEAEAAAIAEITEALGAS
jgi:hypothetical protein